MKLVYVPSLHSVVLYGLVKCGLLYRVEWMMLSALDNGTVVRLLVLRGIRVPVVPRRLRLQLVWLAAVPLVNLMRSLH